MMTTKEIFAANQILTLAVAKTLIGKTISVTNSEYSANTPSVRTAKVLGIKSKWDLAAEEDYTHIDAKYKTRQEQWMSWMTEKQIADMQNALVLIGDKQLNAGCDARSWGGVEPILSGSDEDRPIYYVELNNNGDITVKLTRVFHQKAGNDRVYDFLTNLTLEEVTKKNSFLKKADSTILSTREEMVILNDNPQCIDYFENGILKSEYLDEKPDAYADERGWNEMYQKTTGNPLPKGGILR